MNYYNEIKTSLINNEIYKKVKDYSKNKSDLETYYKVGKLLADAGKHYGEGIIKQYSIRLTNELGKKYNERTLRRFRQFYNFVTKLKWSAVPTKLTWSHITILMVLSDIDKINYYVKVVEERNIGYRELDKLIKSQKYERLPKETKTKLIENKDTFIKDLVPNPIIIKNKNNIDIINEKILHQLIIEDISSFMKELGNGYCFIDSEYKIKIGNNYNYMDLLLFNYEFNCFVVIELKVTELKKEYIGQIEVYMNYVDSNLKKFNQDKTIGIIICKKDNKYIIEYCSNPDIISTTYILN